MENTVKKLNERFYTIISTNSVEGVNKIILSNSYKEIINFINLNKIDRYDGTVIDLLKKYEREAYVSKGKKLTDKQIIRLEFKRIKQEYEKQSKKCISSGIKEDGELNDNSELEINRHLLILVEYYLSQLRIFKEVDNLSKEHLDFLKQRIAYIEILLNMKNGLYYETYLCFIEELERIEKLSKLDIQKETNRIDNLNKQRNR